MLKMGAKLPESMVYFLAKANSVFLGLVFSILYSRALGPESKGILTVVFLATVLFSQIFNGGVDLSFRSRLGGINPKLSAPEYFIFSIISSMFVAILTTVFLLIYSFYKVPIASNYYLVSTGYVFLAVLSEQITQYILSLGKFDWLWKIEFPTIFIQMFTFFVLYKNSELSTAVSVLISFSFSYLIIILRGTRIILKILKINKPSKLNLLKVVGLIRVSKNNSFYNTLLTINDRFDRFIVLWIFPSAIFGKYAVATGILLTARFFPETIGNLILGRQAAGLMKYIQKFKILAFLFISCIPLLAALAVQLFIEYALGEIWGIGFLVILLFAYAELFRGIYLLQVNKLLLGGEAHSLHYSTSLFMVLVGVCTSFIAYLTAEINVIPAGMIVGYLIISTKLFLSLRDLIPKFTPNVT